MPKGIYERKPRLSSYPLKSRLHCTSCHYVWQYKDVSSSTCCPLCGKRIDARDKTEYTKRYMALHPERKEKLSEWYRTYQKQHYGELKLKDRRKVLAIISKSIEPECVNCGCDDIRLLEINHKNGGGGKEYKARGNFTSLYRDIIALRRPVDDLEILCRVCNAKHYLESKYGNLPIVVMWKG